MLSSYRNMTALHKVYAGTVVTSSAGNCLMLNNLPKFLLFGGTSAFGTVWTISGSEIPLANSQHLVHPLSKMAVETHRHCSVDGNSDGAPRKMADTVLVGVCEPILDVRAAHDHAHNHDSRIHSL